MLADHSGSAMESLRIVPELKDLDQMRSRLMLPVKKGCGQHQRASAALARERDSDRSNRQRQD